MRMTALAGAPWSAGVPPARAEAAETPALHGTSAASDPARSSSRRVMPSQAADVWPRTRSMGGGFPGGIQAGRRASRYLKGTPARPDLQQETQRDGGAIDGYA